MENEKGIWVHLISCEIREIELALEGRTAEGVEKLDLDKLKEAAALLAQIKNDLNGIDDNGQEW